MEKQINFNLKLPNEQVELSLSIMLARGYTRQDIIFCFNQLEMNGFGKFDHGHRGKGKFGKFIPTKDLPESYIVFIPVKKLGRPCKNIKE